jgi:hypothetical protein
MTTMTIWILCASERDIMIPPIILFFAFQQFVDGVFEAFYLPKGMGHSFSADTVFFFFFFEHVFFFGGDGQLVSYRVTNHEP